MATVRITRRLHFSAAHRLAHQDWSDEKKPPRLRRLRQPQLARPQLRAGGDRRRSGRTPIPDT